MRLILEHLTDDVVMLCNGRDVVASVQLFSPEVLISPKASEGCFVVLPGIGTYSMSSHHDHEQIWLEVDSVVKAIVNLRANNVAVTFYDKEKFAVRIL